MNKRRSYIEEILSKKARLLKRSRRYDLFMKKQIHLQQAFDYVEDQINSKAPYRAELLKYFPIAIIASLEGYFRLTFSDLIEFGSPYKDNIVNFRDINFDIRTVVAIDGRTVSLGDFIAHLLPIKSLEDINKNMSTILNIDFLAEIGNIPFGVAGELVPLKSLAPKTYKFVKETFRLRHIFCHELAPRERVKINDIGIMLSATLLFVISTESLIQQITERKA